MNLIQELGIEKCRAIVDGAPRGAKKWRDMDSVCSPNEILYYAKGPHFWVVWDVEKNCWVVSIIHDGDEYILDQLQDLNDLRTAIAAYDYNHTDNLSHFTDNCTDIRNHDLSVSNSSQNDTQIDLSIKMDIEDNCTDIRNHVSPNTKVIEHE